MELEKNMKKTIILALLVTVLFGAVSAQAGWFDKKDKEEKAVKAFRYDYYPSMSFHVGTLRRDNYSGWRLDEVSLQLTSGAKMTSGGLEISQLPEGQKALVMGPKVGDTIVGWRVRILESDWNVTRDSSRDHEITWSTSDPTVGVSPAGE